MPGRIIARYQSKPRTALSVGFFVLFTAAMAYPRLYLYPDRILSLTYGLPLLFCLWYPSRRLLWSLVAAFAAIAAYKAFALLPGSEMADFNPALHWSMQIVNMTVIAVTVHLLLRLLDGLRFKNAELEQTNQELLAREEEISRQNEELQAQAEELAEQNEEIQQQAEEVQQQAEELQAQTEELEAANGALARRQALLENLLHSLHGIDAEGDSPRRACESVLTLLGDAAVSAAVVVRDGDELVVRGSAGRIPVSENRRKFARSLAEIVIEHQRPAGIADLALRPDLLVPASATEDGAAFRAILGAPLRFGGKPAGALEVYAGHPYAWTREQFQIIEWAAAQCSLILEARRLHDHVLATNAALDCQVRERTLELQELVNELEHFSYTITHDMRAPLRAMHGYAGMLQEECLSSLGESGREYLQRISTAASRMDQLITDALSYSKAVRLELAMTAIDPIRLLRGMIDSYPMFQPPKARIELIDGIPPVLANEAGLTQCFSNLLSNAVKFVTPGTTPHVRIRAERQPDSLRLWFEDNGIGIPPAMQPRLFRMFQRLSKTYEGTGIGLALVRKVAERMGGRVGVESEPGKGSRFWIDLKPAP
jgi:signal transduction histidine kinase